MTPCMHLQAGGQEAQPGRAMEEEPHRGCVMSSCHDAKTAVGGKSTESTRGKDVSIPTSSSRGMLESCSLALEMTSF